MAETYANNIDRANDFLSNYRQGQAEQASEAATNQLEVYQQKVQALRDHYTHEAMGGGEEIGGAAAFHAVYGKLKDLYNKSKGKVANDKEPNTDKEEDTREDAEEDDGSGQQEVDDAGAKPEAATETEEAPTETEGAEGMGEGVGDSGFGGEFTGRGALDAVGDRFKSRLQFLKDNFPSEPTSAPAGASPAPRTAPEPAAQGGEAPEGYGEATEESAFGDLSSIPKPGTVASVQSKIDAEAATGRGGNVNEGRTSGGDSTTTGGGDLEGGADLNGPADINPAKGLKQTGIQDKIQAGDADEAGGGLLEEGGEQLAEKAGGGLLGELGASVGLDAIPVIGEAAAVVQGLVGIGEGIYHLFHPDNVTKPKAPVLVGRTPAQISAKFSSALPDIDGSVEDSAGSVSAF